MTPTSKVLLGAGAVGIAGYLLWRLWPKAAPPPAYAPPPPPIPGLTQVPVTPTYVPPMAAVSPLGIACPPGTFLENGVCVPHQID